MRALNVFGAPPSAHAKGTNTRGHSENTRELVILDALTGETFRFPWPLSSSAGTGWKKQQREQAAPTELPVASFWINLEHYVHQLLPTLPCLADETGAARRNGNEAEAQRKGPTISKEPQRCLCFVEATGRSLAAEAAAAAALQEGSRSSRSYENSLAQSNGPLSLILLRPELLACLRHSSRRAPAAAAAVAPNPPSPSHSMAPKASSAVKAAKEQQKGKRDHDILGDAPPIAGGGGSTTCREAFAAVAAAPAAGDSGSFDGTCACSSSGCFSFPSASVQQRLVSGELRALRAAALLDGDASFKVFGNNVVAAACSCCCSRSPPAHEAPADSSRSPRTCTAAARRVGLEVG
ncbi:uncharacterized protein EMH_0070170 [Eimeria mitis]|uniref:Uncharacterized protein n=1 Tax=Eimeria mitis TaxID=44415 RepID=U6K2B0_9EIME|nr:uncharacterized protein EMH_0070170 [Eimeria mitis]CDJ31840.1 hypothetical protein EMH_0070170 [Eimeria mitis]